MALGAHGRRTISFQHEQMGEGQLTWHLPKAAWLLYAICLII
jgi:hypothetical protein